MANVYSTAFIFQRGLAGNATYTVPAGFVVVVRDVDVYWGQQPVAPTGLVLGAAGQAFWSWAGAIFAANNDNWRGRHVMNAGDVLTVSVTNGNADVSVSGYRLVAP